MRCQTCAVPVHRTCYTSPSDSIPAQTLTWTCEVCVSGVELVRLKFQPTLTLQPICSLCNESRGAMKCIDGTWVHPSCYYPRERVRPVPPPPSHARRSGCSSLTTSASQRI
jgi:hypothetical protein